MIGSGTGSFTVNVLYGPEFKLGEQDVAVPMEENITLVCAQNVTSNPASSVEWTDNVGNTIADGERHTNDPSVVSLTIVHATTNDSGNWSCSVSVIGPNNETAGESQHTIMLTVLSLEM